jgi:hypothetical protein
LNADRQRCMRLSLHLPTRAEVGQMSAVLQRWCTPSSRSDIP